MHIDYLNLVNKIANSCWGMKDSSEEELEKKLVNDNPTLTSFALLEIIKRMNAIGAACGKAPSDEFTTSKVMKIGTPKEFPGKQVGDRLYAWDMDSGCTESVIISMNIQHHCVVIVIDELDTEHAPLCWLANNYYWPTLKEAMKQEATEKIDEYSQAAQAARDCLDAIELGQDFERFRNGMYEDE